MGFNDLPFANNTAELYDPTTQTFTAIAATLTTSRNDHPTATLLPNGQVLLTGGKSSKVIFNNTAELYDPATQTFAAIAATMKSVRASHTATLLPSGLVLLTGGATFLSASNPSSSVILNSVEIYDPTAQTFTAVTATMTSHRAFHTGTLLASSSVLLTGGVNVSPTTNSFVVLNTTEAYRP